MQFSISMNHLLQWIESHAITGEGYVNGIESDTYRDTIQNIPMEIKKKTKQMNNRSLKWETHKKMVTKMNMDAPTNQLCFFYLFVFFILQIILNCFPVFQRLSIVLFYISTTNVKSVLYRRYETRTHIIAFNISVGWSGSIRWRITKQKNKQNEKLCDSLRFKQKSIYHMHISKWKKNEAL